MNAVIIGASSGIGFGLAQSLLNKGHSVYAFSKNKPQDERIVFFECDVTKHESIKIAFAKYFEKQDKLDLLVCNAGVSHIGALENASAEDIKRVLDINLLGSIYASQIAAKKMREQRSGKIVFVNSLASVFAIPFQIPYSISKVGLSMLTDGLKNELRPFNVQVCSMMLGDINTGFTKKQEKEINDEVYGERIKKSKNQMIKDESKGMCINKATKKMAKYMSKKKLKPRKTIGTFFYKLVAFLAKILPQRLLVWVVGKMY